MTRTKTQSKQKSTPSKIPRMKGHLAKIDPKTAKTIRERAFEEQLKGMSKTEKKKELTWMIKHKSKKIKKIKKDLDQAKQLASQKGPYSFEAEVRVPQKREEYQQMKRDITNYERRLARINLSKKHKSTGD